jgi:hypothetical protein
MTYRKNEYNRGRRDGRITKFMSLSQCARKETQECSNRDPALFLVRKAQEPTRRRHALKNVGVQFISYRDDLNRDEKRAQRERDKAVDKRAIERDAAD